MLKKVFASIAICLTPVFIIMSILFLLSDEFGSFLWSFITGMAFFTLSFLYFRSFDKEEKEKNERKLYSFCQTNKITEYPENDKILKQKLSQYAKQCKIKCENREDFDKFYAPYVVKEIEKKKQSELDSIQRAAQAYEHDKNSRNAIASSWLKIVGRDKRKELLNKELKDARNYLKDTQLTNQMLKNSNKKPENTGWEILAGASMALGVGGVVAGSMAATEGRAEEIANEQHNKMVDQTWDYTSQGSMMNSRINQAANSVRNLENEISRIDMLYVDSDSNSFDYLKFDNCKIYQNTSLSCITLDISVDISSDEINEYKDKIKTVIDGYIGLGVSYNNTLIDTVILQLPIYGINDKETVKLSGKSYTDIPSNSKDFDISKIQISYTDVNTWIIER